MKDLLFSVSTMSRIQVKTFTIVCFPLLNRNNNREDVCKKKQTC